MSLSSLCLTMGKPPIGQLRACSTVNGFPCIQCEARPFGSYPHISKTQSILECALVQGETMVLYIWAGRSARWRHLFRKRDLDTTGSIVVVVIEYYVQLPAGSPYHRPLTSFVLALA